MQVINRASLTADSLAEIRRELGEPHSLLEVLSWAKSQPPESLTPQVVAGVVTQDEYTHDVIVPWRDGLVLVYDTT
jgi:hypothetical protein